VGAVYLLKSLIPLMAITLGLQAIAELLRNLLLLMGVALPTGGPANGPTSGEGSDQ
jgi:hypothetical protein